MEFSELTAIWPQSSLDEMPQAIDDDDVDSLLAAWSALWHPLLLASTSSLPSWCSAEDPPSNLNNCIVVVPTVSTPFLEADFVPRARQKGACVIVGVHDRASIVEQIISNCNLSVEEIDSDLVSDFMALGYCHLQIELLTRQMRYANTLDLAFFKKQTMSGADAVLRGDCITAHEHLSKCFDALAQERDHYYPMDVYLVDLLLMAPTTIGNAFVNELQDSTPVNVMISAEVVQHMADTSPASLSVLHAAVKEGQVDIVGGELSEGCLSMLTLESVRDQFERGFETYLNVLGKRPTVYGRRRFGLSPILPQILDSLEYEGALHATLDDGQFPVGSQPKSRWQGIDGSEIESLSRVPLDASRSSNYLNFATKLSETMDGDHVATVCLAHWPGQAASWREDLLRIAQYNPVLGKFVTLTTYFEQTQHSGYGDRHGLDRYQNPYLQQAVVAGEIDPISKWSNYFREMAIQMAHSISVTMETLITETGTSSSANGTTASDNQPGVTGNNVAQALAATRTCKKDVTEMGMLVWNPWIFSRRCYLELPADHPVPLAQQPTYCAERCVDHPRAVIDVPSTGFAWIRCGTGSPRVKPPSRPMAEGYTLRNEYMEVNIDPDTGSLRSLHDYHHRGNRLSQQLGYRLPTQQSPHHHTAPDYSVMAADHVAVTSSTSVLGEITCRGRLLDSEGRALVDYQQSYRLWRGSRVLMLSIQLDVHEPLLPNPWNSYIACRFAWNDVGATIVRDVAYTRQPTEARRFEAPHYVEIEMPDGCTSLFTHGLPFHQRIGPRMLDSLLVVHGETAREFQLGIGLDLDFPLHEALSLVGPRECHYQASAPPTSSKTAWLLHIDAKNVIITHIEPWMAENCLIGIRARILETGGRRTNAWLSCFRRFGEAHKINLVGRKIATCDVEDNRVQLDLNGYEWATIEARFDEE